MVPAVRYSPFGQPSFCAVLEASCRLTVDGQRPLTLEAGDFVLLPATPGFKMWGFDLDAALRRPCERAHRRAPAHKATISTSKRYAVLHAWSLDR